ncbi:MAG: Uma2 family endonuclease [Planctomycetes bacterium]|nr:Uma2 family endonuclease [Planctomycetota bacterium]
MVQQLLPRLENGDHLSQHAFHERYCASPEDFRAELIGGIVFVRGRVTLAHGEMHAAAVGWLGVYRANTPGVTASNSPTTLLGKRSEPEPDGVLCIDADCGGRSYVSDDDFLTGPPELIVEVAASADAIDMHAKRRDYERAGVLEYVAVLLRESAVRWFVLEDGAYRDLEARDDGILCSRVFPGLWLDPSALLRLDGRRVLDVLQKGIEDPSHQVFVDELAKR